MPRVEATIEVPVSAADAFAMSQSQGDVRFAWDNFLVEQHLMHGAERPDKGVQTFSRSKHRLTMVSEYTSFRPPNQVGMKMVEGPHGPCRFPRLSSGSLDKCLHRTVVRNYIAVVPGRELTRVRCHTP